MSLENKTGDRTPFQMGEEPMAPKMFLMPFVWGASFMATRKFHLTIKRDLRGVKPPYLVLSTHQGYSDYYIAPLALFPHRANYVSDMEGFAAFGKRLYRWIGCIGKRRYVADITVVRHIRSCLEQKRAVVLFPESRHSNVGTTAVIPDNLGKLVKMMNVPLVLLTAHGSYLANPFWDETHTRRVPMEATLQCLYTRQELQKVDAKQIQKRLEEEFQYDEYAWQRENTISLTQPRRAEGLEKALYQCKNCGDTWHMTSSGNRIRCTSCGAQWQMTEYGNLHRMGTQGGDIPIPDWYEWERKEAIRDWDSQDRPLQFAVRVEALYNEKGFVSLGQGTLLMDKKAFTLLVEEEKIVFSHRIRESVQTEYDYRGRGECIVLSTRDCSYYLYPEANGFHATWMQFVGEESYRRRNESGIPHRNKGNRKTVGS